MTITFSDSVNIDSVRLDRLSFDDDNGGPNTDVVFTDGTILTENTLPSEIQASLIYGSIIDQWGGSDIWGNVVSLVNAVEALDLSTLILSVDEGAFIDNNAEPFIDADSNGVYSPAEQFTDLNGDSLWTPAEPFTDLNDNGSWDDVEQFTDVNDNGIWDAAEEFTDCGVNNDGIYICDYDDGWDESYGNGFCDGLESFEDGYLLFPEDGFWNFNDSNGNGICDNVGPPPLWECEPFEDDNGNGLCDQEPFNDVDGDGIWFPGEELTDINGNNVWDDAEEFTDLNGNGIWDDAEPFLDFDGDNEFDEVSEEFTDLNNNGVWDPYTNAISETTVNMPVTGTDIYPILDYTMYDANINQLMLVFDRLVQFDQIPEDESFLGGPGDGNLNSGEDRNGNGVLDMEANINSSKIGFTDYYGQNINIEGFDQIVQIADNDTMQIVLTRDDSRRLETMLNISSMSVNLFEGAFLDTFYNPSADTMLPATTIMDSLPLLADSAIYNISENKLSIFFRSSETNNRRVVTDPAPIYSKIFLSVGNSSMNLSGINGIPFVLQDIILRIQQLMLSDQRDLEMLIDEIDTGDTLFLTIDEYAVYDENNNGNLEVIDLPVIITSSDDIDKQPPQIVSSGIVYDADTDILILPWNMGVGFFNEIPIPEESGLSGYSDLEGIAFFDSLEDSLITFDQGEVYYPTSNDTTFIKLSEIDAGLLENYPNRDTLILTIEPYTFYSAGTYNNGNKAVTEDSLFLVTYQWDNTGPVVNEVLFNIIDSTIAITLNELVIADFLYPEKLTFGGVEIDGDIVVDSAAQYISNFSVKVSSEVYNAITSIDDNVKINPPFQAADSAFVNADGTFSAWIEREAHYGREFWIQSFEAFPPPPYLVFSSLRSIGNNCDIYVDDQVWGTKINSADLVAIVTAFDETAPNDSSQGIFGLAQDFLDASAEDTDGNGKVIFVFTDILDEYGKGRNDTKSSLYVHGYSTILDTLDGEPHSNHGDIIYFDADPMSLNADDEDLRATYNAISHEYTRMIMEHNQFDQENWIIEGISAILQKKMAGDVRFFGISTSPDITSGNQLTYIATGYQSLKGRKDKWNAHLFLSYLQEKYTVDGTGWDIIQEIARSDSIGIKAVSDALVTLGINTDVRDIFADYSMACYLDAVHVDSLYNGSYNFEGFNLQTPPSGKPAALLSWDESIGKGAPYTKSDILPWSYNYLIMRGYSFDLEGNVNYLSPDLNAEDTLYFGGLHDVPFKIKKLMLKSGFLDPMNPEYEVTDFELDDQTSYGTLPVTTDPLFAFKDTLDNAQNGVQLMLLLITKTDDAQPSEVYDFVISNMHLSGPAPANVRVESFNDHIQIQWDPPPPFGLVIFDSYQVLRRDLGEFGFNLLDDGLTSLQYDDFTPDTGYFYEYVVLGEYNDGTTGDTSDVVEGSLLEEADEGGEGDIGFSTAITNYGSIGDPTSPYTGRPSCEYPAYSGNNYLYDGGLWVGGEVYGQRPVTTYFYNPHVEWLPCSSSGTRPEKAFTILNDTNHVEVCFDDLESHSESNHVPLGIKVYAHYQLSPSITNPETEESEIAPWGTLSYSIINTGLNGYLTDIYVGLWLDFDVSSADNTEPHIDDLVDYDEDLKLSYMYDGDHPGSSEDDIGENGQSEGYVGIALVSSPNNSVASHAWWNWESDPMDLDNDKYEYMSAVHPAMEGYQYLPNPLELGYPPFDYRILQTTGPFDMAEGDTIEVEYLLVFGNNYDDIRQNVVTAWETSLGIDVNFASGWNMVGLPSEVVDPFYLTIFPSAIENTLFSFDLTYNPDTLLINGEGYWLKFNDAGTTTIRGTPLNELIISLEEDWNFISGIANTISIYSITDPDGIIVPGTLYGFNGTYEQNLTMYPGQGYWLRAFQDGEITLTSGTLAKTVSQDFSLKGKSNTLNVNGSELSFGVELSDIEMLSYSLPPKPPAGAFDIRFKGDTRVTKEKAEIELMSPYESLIISYNVVIDAGEHMNWVLSSDNGKDYILEGSGEITVPSAERFVLSREPVIPITFALHQNYPNPFNPITTLRYDLPSDAFVTLSIYDMLGREVTQLVNNTQQAGFKSVQWNGKDSMGKNISAGVYLYQIQAGDFVQTKKMVLLK